MVVDKMAAMADYRLQLIAQQNTWYWSLPLG